MKQRRIAAGTYWVNFHVGELVSGSAMVVMEGFVGEGSASTLQKVD